MIKSREDMDRYLAAQMEKLGTDHIDYYLLHSLYGASWDNLQRLGALKFLGEALKDGRIVNAGFSFHGLIEDFERIVDAYPGSSAKSSTTTWTRTTRQAPKA